MKRRKLPVAGWKIVLTILIASIATVGTSYTAWSDTLHVIGKVTTGAFDMVFHDNLEQYTVSIVNGEGSSNNIKKIIDPWTYDIDIVHEGKTAEISFEGPLPLELIMDGNYLKFTYPMVSGKGTVTQLKQEQANFSEPWQTVTFRPLARFVVLSGQKYTMDNLAAGYAVPLEFNVYRALQCPEAEEYLGSAYLELTPESREVIAGLPRTAQLLASELETAVPVADGEDHPQDGVLVLYEGAIPIALDQKPITDN